jgi:long-chain acyl-CoA synthetase
MNIKPLRSAGEYLQHHFERNGKRPFIKQEDSSNYISYSEFLERVQKTANVLLNKDLTPNQRIVLELDNSLQGLTVFFAMLFAKIVPIVVSPSMTIAELQQIISTSNAVAIIGSQKKFGKEKGNFIVPAFDIKTLRPHCSSSSFPVESPESPNVAYIVYTTGSTGVPKKVRVTHNNMQSEINSMTEAYATVCDDRHYCVLPIYHASGLYRNILLPIHTGGRCVLASSFQYKTFWRIIKEEQITFTQVVPSILRILLDNKEYYSQECKETLKYVGSASEPHPIELVKSFEKQFEVYVLQGYGMTEATCGITLNPLSQKERKLGSVGRPISVNYLEIQDEEGIPLPLGETGRLIVRGENITSISEVGEFTSPKGEEGVLDTGDMAYLDEEHFLWLVGRKQDFIKRGGYRISLKEISDAISIEFPTLDVAVIAVPNQLLGNDIIAFANKTPANLTSREILKKIKGKLASYKIPSEIVFMESLPKLGVGKTDKSKLISLYNETFK